MFRKTAAALIACMICAKAAPAAEIELQRLNTRDYQAFVVNWAPSETPLCAVLQTAAQWGRVMHPAPVMFQKTVFGPPADFWSGHAVLLIARAVSGSGGDSFRSYRVRASRVGLEVDYNLSPPPGASYSTKAYLALAVAKPLAGKISFTDESGVACRLDLDKGVWVSPDIMKPAGAVRHPRSP